MERNQSRGPSERSWRKGGRGLSMIIQHVACRTWKDQLSIHAFIKNILKRKAVHFKVHRKRHHCIHDCRTSTLYIYMKYRLQYWPYILCSELTFEIEDIHTISFQTEYCSNAGFYVALIGNALYVFSRMWQLYIFRTDLNW